MGGTKNKTCTGHEARPVMSVVYALALPCRACLVSFLRHDVNGENRQKKHAQVMKLDL